MTFTTTEIKLGKCKVIRQPVTQKGYCGYCFKTVTITTNGKCIICGAVFFKQKTYASLIERFEKFLSVNKDLTRDVLIPMPIGKKTYYIPLSRFNEYIQIRNNKIAVSYFMDNIKKDCKSVCFS